MRCGQLTSPAPTHEWKSVKPQLLPHTSTSPTWMCRVSLNALFQPNHGSDKLPKQNLHKIYYDYKIVIKWDIMQNPMINK